MNDLGNKEIFSKNLRYYMTIHDKTRNDICKDLDFKYTTFTDWYNGNIYPGIDKIEKIANYFRIEKSDLIENKDKKNTSSNSTTILVYGTIPAGIPLECIEDILDTEEISIDMLKGEKQYFGLKVKGNSMNPDYLDGDTLILLKQDDCESGDDCVVMVNGDDGTFKRVIKNQETHTIRLQPLNTSLDKNGLPLYEPRTFAEEEIEQLPVRILGVVVEIRRKKRKK